jgi:Arc/MetJ family transcription regulator
MRTTMVLDDKLVKEVMKLANVKTRREAVHIALNRFVQGGRQKRLLDLHGAGGVRKDYGDKTLRAGS